jgi:hypothetical protein
VRTRSKAVVSGVAARVVPVSVCCSITGSSSARLLIEKRMATSPTRISRVGLAGHHLEGHNHRAGESTSPANAALEFQIDEQSGPDAHRHASRDDYEPGPAGLSLPAVPSQG